MGAAGHQGVWMEHVSTHPPQAERDLVCSCPGSHTPHPQCLDITRQQIPAPLSSSTSGQNAPCSLLVVGPHLGWHRRGASRRRLLVALPCQGRLWRPLLSSPQWPEPFLGPHASFYKGIASRRGRCPGSEQEGAADGRPLPPGRAGQKNPTGATMANGSSGPASLSRRVVHPSALVRMALGQICSGVQVCALAGTRAQSWVGGAGQPQSSQGPLGLLSFPVDLPGVLAVSCGGPP